MRRSSRRASALGANTSPSIFYAGQLAETDTNNMLKGRFTLRV
ncbi:MULTISPECIES: hypothetical protein [unclassified Bradyrhizobium]